MSRIGKMPVPVPAGVKASVDGARVTVKGPKGELSYTLPDAISARLDGDVLRLENGVGESAKGLHGLARSQVANMVAGVTQGYAKELELQGVGFKASLAGNKLTLLIGFSHPVVCEAPAGIQFAVKDTRITVSGADKQQVGDVAARIRSYYKPEPYKGKGVRYVNEHVRRKAGKTVA